MLSSLPSSFFGVLQAMKVVVLTLFLAVLLLAFLVLLVLSRDAVDNCGFYCPHSPVHLLYSFLEPYLYHYKAYTPM